MNKNAHIVINQAHLNPEQAATLSATCEDFRKDLEDGCLKGDAHGDSMNAGYLDHLWSIRDLSESVLPTEPVSGFSAHPVAKFPEPIIFLNGKEIPSQYSMTIRVAIEHFAYTISEKKGTAEAENYTPHMPRINEIRELIFRNLNK